MEIKKGIAVSPGIAIARSLVIDSEDYRIPRRSILPSVKVIEVKRVRDAFKKAVAELEKVDSGENIAEGKIKDIFAVHLRFLKDKNLRKKITDLVYNELLTAEYAVSTTLRDIANHFASVQDKYISERATDIYDIEKRLLRHLLGRKREDVGHISHEVVVVAHELSPTQTAGFDRKFIKGFATDAGGRTSHTAIVARSLGIPAVVGLEDVTRNIAPAAMVIIDGNRGVVIIEPDEPTIKEYQQHAIEFERLERELDALRDLDAVTRDGVKVELYGNIEFPHEAEMVIDKGGQGIGLYRTEFLYLYSETEPTEEDQYRAYSEVIRVFGNMPIVIRTMDLGADKFTQSRRFVREPNPFLGLRSIRFCLQNIVLFKTQLRAILRASVHGDVRIMFPLISSLHELRQAKMILRDVMEDLDEDGIKYNSNMPVGIMVETPSAALTASILASESDFFSIGTNDLIQYTLAVDRGNERVSTLYSGADPAVVNLLRSIIHDANKAKISVSVCGEMASEPEFVMLLLGLGFRTFSLAPPMIPEIKKLVRSVTVESCNIIARKVLMMSSEREVINYLRSAAMKVLPEVF
ncbi:MAG: phosphoenolpyruvate--protein phosphotransferase [Planctomycetes bacterium]|nr:phosphoenolpyruvate--protein phosphotransferase [Planctomycetota bacterium]MBU1518582.1 phosphoenolpyruvate--protein phosphotransferase [Planctomycetota bacterium]MBU2458475.1 phosphoenolpyruvate--protein phosphotransferase [Planctomycetota bacterium]MBU2596227.1 phosphoenolpyruvate--protein phosphotransferase [Planctomycetota bacterium]